MSHSGARSYFLRDVALLPLRLVRLPFDILFLTFDFLRVALWGLGNLPRVLRGHSARPFGSRFDGAIVVDGGDASRRVCNLAPKYGTKTLLWLLFSTVCWHREDKGRPVLCWLGRRSSAPTTLGRFVFCGLVLGLLRGGLAAGVLSQMGRAGGLRDRLLGRSHSGVQQRTPAPFVDDQNAAKALESIAKAAEAEGLKKTEEARDQYREAVRFDRGNIEAKVGLGRTSLELARLDEAKNAFEGALELNPKHHEALLGMAAALRRQEANQQAIGYLDTLLLDDPNSVKALALKTNCLLTLNDNDSALATVGAAIIVAPQDPDVLDAAAAVHLKLGNLTRAESFYRALIDADAGNVAARLGVAEITRQKGDLPKAESLISAVYADAPDDARAAEALIDICRQRGKQVAALRLCRDIVERHPESTGVRVRLCSLLFEAGLDNELCQACSALLEYSPGNAMAHAYLAKLFFRLGLFQMAVDSAAKAAAQEPLNGGIYRLYVAALIQNGDLSAAEERLQRLLAAAPEDREGLLQQAEIQRRQGKSDAALATLQAASAAYPDDFTIHEQIAQLHFNAGRKDAAVASFRAAYALAPENAATLNNLAAAINLAGGDLDEALGYALKAKAKSPGNAQILDTLAWIRAARKEYTQALPLIELAEALRPGIPVMAYHHAAILASLERRQEAVVLLRRVLDSGAPFDMADEAKALLADLEAASEKR